MNQNEKIKQILTKQLEMIKIRKKQVQQSLKNAPEGSLVLSRSKGVVQFFHKTEKGQKKGKYIEKSNQKLVLALAQKDYDKIFLKEVEKQEQQIEKVLKYLPEKGLGEIYANLSEARKQLVKPHVLSDEEYIQQWVNVKYAGKIYHEEFLKYQTERGEKVRSKSEKIIADKMYIMGIPYRYEYPLQTRGLGVIYPDFTILIVSSRKEVYYEHFGMMDKPEYCEKAMMRLQELARHDIILGKNLFATFETTNTPLDINQVEKILKNICWL